MRLTGHATVLLVEDVARATAYYRDALGFEVEQFEVNPTHYGYASRDGCHLHFARFDGARPRPNSEVVPPDMFDAYFWVDDVDASTRSSSTAGPSCCTGRSTRGTDTARSACATRTATFSRSASRSARRA